MKNYLLVLALMLSSFAYAQEPIKSKTREFYEKSEQSRINMDVNVVAEFVSGHGETVTFFPIEIVDLKTEEVIKALQIGMLIDGPAGQATLRKNAWVDYDEIDGFITFLETYIIPKLKQPQANKTYKKFTFRSKEITLIYTFDTSRTNGTKPDLMLKISLNRYDDIKASDYTTYTNYTFWTERKAKYIPKVLEVLKSIRDNK